MTNPETPTVRRYVIDRGWSIRVGPIRLGGWYRSYAYDGRTGISRSQTRGIFFSTRAIMAGGLLCLCVFAAINLATDQARAKSGYAITIAVPPAMERLPGTRSAQPVAVVNAEASATKARPDSKIRSIASRRPTASPTLGAPARLMGVLPLLSVSQAQNAALATGEMRQWDNLETGVHGFVVVGPLKDDGGTTCRAMSTLTRSADGDTVAEQQVCPH